MLVGVTVLVTAEPERGPLGDRSSFVPACRLPPQSVKGMALFILHLKGNRGIGVPI